MTQENEYYIVRKKALPEVLQSVVEAKRLMETVKGMTVQKATKAVGISRSSFYKYKEDIFPFNENTRGKTITFMLQIGDVPGLLSHVLQVIANYHANLLTIHQTIPINGMASLTLSIDILPATRDVADMINEIEQIDGVHELKILARE